MKVPIKADKFLLLSRVVFKPTHKEVERDLDLLFYMVPEPITCLWKTPVN